MILSCYGGFSKLKTVIMQRIIQILWFSCCKKARESDEREDLNFDMWSDHQSLIFSDCYKDIKLSVWILSRISSLIPSSCSTLIVIICDAVDKRRFSFQKNQRFTENLFQINHIWSRWFQRTNFKGLFQKSYFKCHIINFCSVHVVWVFTVMNLFLLMQIPLRDCKRIEFVEKENNPFAEWVRFSVCSFSCWHLFRVLNQFGELMNGEWSGKAPLMTLSCYFFSFIQRFGCTF